MRRRQDRKRSQYYQNEPCELLGFFTLFPHTVPLHACKQWEDTERWNEDTRFATVELGFIRTISHEVKTRAIRIQSNFRGSDLTC